MWINLSKKSNISICWKCLSHVLKIDEYVDLKELRFIDMLVWGRWSFSSVWPLHMIAL